MFSLPKRFWGDESGATAVEYGLIVALIAVVVITGITSVGSHLATRFNSTATSVASAGS